MRILKTCEKCDEAYKRDSGYLHRDGKCVLNTSKLTIESLVTDNLIEKTPAEKPQLGQPSPVFERLQILTDRLRENKKEKDNILEELKAITLELGY